MEKLQLGDIVTFSYEKNARREVPGNAKIYRVRHDLDWNEVLLSDTKKKEIFLNGIIFIKRELLDYIILTEI